MKILRIIARLNVGGPARHVVWLTEALNDEEFESVLVAGTVPPTEEDMGYFADQYGVEPVFIEEMSRELSPKDAVSLWKVWRTILREKPDIIHTHTAKAGTVGRAAGFLYKWLTPGTLVGRPRRVKLVHTYHGHIFHSYYGKAKTRFFLFIERTLARLATDRIITITEQQRNEINEDFGIGRGKQFEVIPLGIDLSAFEDPDSRRSAFRRQIGASDGDIVIGIVGRLTDIKDHELFLRAASELSHEFHEGNHGKHGEAQREKGAVRFVVIGNGHLRRELEELAEGLGVSDLVTFLGNREDPETFYAGLDIVALTSKNEGTPLSLIEAMASRRPVVSTAVGGVVDLLGDRRPKTEDREDVGAGPPKETGDRRQETGDRRQGTGIGTPSASEGHSRSQETGIGTPSASEGHSRSQKSEVRRQAGIRDSHALDTSSQLTAHSSQLTAHGSPVQICQRGIAVTSRDPQAFADALRLLAEDRALRESLADAGYEFVKQRYDKARLIADIKELYRRLIIDN
ncbi:MAG TPA: glycosyltransferase [Aridibacter sp.]|nr:glycosyltransferase [Aridibacter sp.]